MEALTVVAVRTLRKGGEAVATCLAILFYHGLLPTTVVAVTASRGAKRIKELRTSAL
jgi:hypothetical protein